MTDSVSKTIAGIPAGGAIPPPQDLIRLFSEDQFWSGNPELDQTLKNAADDFVTATCNTSGTDENGAFKALTSVSQTARLILQGAWQADPSLDLPWFPVFTAVKMRFGRHVVGQLSESDHKSYGADPVKAVFNILSDEMDGALSSVDFTKCRFLWANGRLPEDLELFTPGQLKVYGAAKIADWSDSPLACAGVAGFAIASTIVFPPALYLWVGGGAANAAIINKSADYDLADAGRSGRPEDVMDAYVEKGNAGGQFIASVTPLVAKGLAVRLGRSTPTGLAVRPATFPKPPLRVIHIRGALPGPVAEGPTVSPQPVPPPTEPVPVSPRAGVSARPQSSPEPAEVVDVEWELVQPEEARPVATRVVTKTDVAVQRVLDGNPPPELPILRQFRGGLWGRPNPDVDVLPGDVQVYEQIVLDSNTPPSAATAVVVGADGGTHKEGSAPAKMSLAGKDDEPPFDEAHGKPTNKVPGTDPDPFSVTAFARLFGMTGQELVSELEWLGKAWDESPPQQAPASYFTDTRHAEFVLSTLYRGKRRAKLSLADHTVALVLIDGRLFVSEYDGMLRTYFGLDPDHFERAGSYHVLLPLGVWLAGMRDGWIPEELGIPQEEVSHSGRMFQLQLSGRDTDSVDYGSIIFSRDLKADPKEAEPFNPNLLVIDPETHQIRYGEGPDAVDVSRVLLNLRNLQAFLARFGRKSDALDRFLSAGKQPGTEDRIKLGPLIFFLSGSQSGMLYVTLHTPYSPVPDIPLSLQLAYSPDGKLKTFDGYLAHFPRNSSPFFTPPHLLEWSIENRHVGPYELPVAVHTKDGRDFSTIVTSEIPTPDLPVPGRSTSFRPPSIFDGFENRTHLRNYATLDEEIEEEIEEKSADSENSSTDLRNYIDTLNEEISAGKPVLYTVSFSPEAGWFHLKVRRYAHPFLSISVDPKMWRGAISSFNLLGQEKPTQLEIEEIVRSRLPSYIPASDKSGYDNKVDLRTRLAETELLRGIEYLTVEPLEAGEADAQLAAMDERLYIDLIDFIEKVREDRAGFFRGMNGYDLFYGEYSTSVAYVSFTYSSDILDDIRAYVAGEASPQQINRLATRFSVSNHEPLPEHFIAPVARNWIEGLTLRVLRVASSAEANRPGDPEDPSFTLLFNLRVSPPPKAGGTPPRSSGKDSKRKRGETSVRELGVFMNEVSGADSNPLVAYAESLPVIDETKPDPRPSTLTTSVWMPVPPPGPSFVPPATTSTVVDAGGGTHKENSGASGMSLAGSDRGNGNKQSGATAIIAGAKKGALPRVTVNSLRPSASSPSSIPSEILAQVRSAFRQMPNRSSQSLREFLERVNRIFPLNSREACAQLEASLVSEGTYLVLMRDGLGIGDMPSDQIFASGGKFELFEIKITEKKTAAINLSLPSGESVAVDFPVFIGRFVGASPPFDAWATPQQVVIWGNPQQIPTLLAHEGLHAVLEKCFAIGTGGNKTSTLDFSVVGKSTQVQATTNQFHEIVAVSGQMAYGDVTSLAPAYIIMSPNDPYYGPAVRLLRQIWNSRYPSFSIGVNDEISGPQVLPTQQRIWELLNGNASLRQNILRDMQALFVSALAQVSSFSQTGHSS